MNLLLIALPYASVAIFFVGLIWRFRSGMTISSQSSQILESRWLVWGSIPFHIGIFVLFAGHLIPLLLPDTWRGFVSNRHALLAMESLGAAAAILCLIGLVVLFVRRVASAVRASSNAADIVVLAVLIAQVVLGLD